MDSRKLFPVICIADEAIDPDNSDVDKYSRERDPSLLKFLPGERPAIFHTIRLPTSVVLRSVERMNTEAEKFTMAFMFGVVKVENFVEEGRREPYTWAPEETIATPSAGKLSAITEEEMNLFTPAEILDVGSVIYQRAFLKKARKPLFVPQPTSVAACAARIAGYRLVAEQEALQQSNTEQAEQQAKTQDESGAEPTAASAAEAS